MQTGLRLPVHLEVSTGNLAGPALVSFSYDPASVPAGIAPADYFGISTYDPATASWLTIPSTVDTTRHLVVAEVTHFSWWNPFSWDFDKINARISQDVLQAIGLRSPAPACDGSGYPSYITQVNTLSDASDPLRSCADTNSGVLEVKLANNRSYGMILTYPTSVNWGRHANDGSILDKVLDAAIDQGLPSNQLYIPALQKASVGIPDGPFSFVTFSAKPSTANMVVSLADLVFPVITNNDLLAKKVAETCAHLLTTFSPPTSINAIAGDLSGIGDCLQQGLEEAIATNTLSRDDISKLKLSEAKTTILKGLKKFASLASIGIMLGSLADLVLGAKVDGPLRQFSILHRHVPVTTPTSPPVTSPPATSPPATSPPATSPPEINPPPSAGFTVGSTFSDECQIAWPTAPTYSTHAISMTMSCQHVPESQYLLTQVHYGDPNLPVTPSTGWMHVVGHVVDINRSGYGFRELVIDASNIRFG